MSPSAQTGHSMLHGPAISACLATLTACIGIAPAARADEPVTIPVVGPMTISQPGIYVLSDHLVFTGSESILIASDHVTLDFRGRSITASPQEVAISIGDFNDVTLRNGVVDAWYPIVSRARSITIRNMRIGGCDWCVQLYDPERVTVESSIFNGYVAGLVAGGERPAEVLISGNSATALIYPMSIGASSGAIVNNTIRALQRGGLSVGASGPMLISGNSVTGGSSTANNAGISIFANDSVITDNSATVVNGPGMILVGSGNIVAGNTLNNNGQRGLIVYSDGNTIEFNVMSGNGWHGIQIDSDYNIISSNVLTNNIGCGLAFTLDTHSNEHQNNTFLNNEGGDICQKP